MRLRELSGVDNDSEVTGFAIDHRKVARGSVFGAFRGAALNGEDFIGQAVERGAAAVVARPQAPVASVPHLADPEPRALFMIWNSDSRSSTTAPADTASRSSE